MKLFEVAMQLGGYKKYRPINEVSEKRLKELGFKQYLKTEPVWARKAEKDFTVDTLEGDDISGKEGDYLLVGIKGEIWPCDSEIFNTTYEEV